MFRVIKDKINDPNLTVSLVVGSNEYEVTDIAKIEYERGFDNSNIVETYISVTTAANGTYIISQIDSTMFKEVVV